MPAKKSHVPKYCLHKPSGRAYIRIHGKVIYLGVYDSPESKQEYGRLITEFAAQPAGSTEPVGRGEGITVVELIAAFLDHTESYYSKNGKPTGHVYAIRSAMRTLKDLYGHKPAAEFGPVALRAIQGKLVEGGGCRNYVNKQAGFIKLCFRWGVSHEIIPTTVHQALTTVPGLRRGRTEARESKPVLPVSDELVSATLPHMPETVADMVRIHRRIGCRPGELCQLRPCDVDVTGDVWVYRPESHKTEHHGRERAIYIGPKAQIILRSYFDRDPEAYCFSPAESEEKRLAQLHAVRKTPIKYGNRPGTNRRRKPKRKPRTFYTKDSYNQAIRRAIEKGNQARAKEAEDMGVVPILLDHWHANQLRHSRGTEVRHKYGLEAAQVILGHAKADVTQTYAERDATLAAEITRKSG